jgi:hypothetical protein
VPAAGLTAEQAALLLGSDANAAIYDQSDPVTRESAADSASRSATACASRA